MMDRTKPPPHACYPPVTFDHSIGGSQWVIHMLEEDEPARIIASSPEECIRLAWEHYDRITLPARVALLRELAAEMESGEIGFTEEKTGLRALDIEEIRERADALEGK